MNWIRIITVVLTLFLGLDLLAQDALYNFNTPRGRTKQRNKFKKKNKMAVICPGMQTSGFPYQSLGFKIGDPFAITYKMYVVQHLAIVADVGRSAQGLYQNYYRERFNSYNEFDTLSYSNHSIDRNLVVQGRILYQGAGPKSIKGLEWYVGVGWQWQFTNVDYEYLYEPIPNFPEVGFDNKDTVPTGPEGTIGVEYSYFDIPIVAFFELQYFQSINLDQSMQRIMGGAGLRYVF